MRVLNFLAVLTLFGILVVELIVAAMVAFPQNANLPYPNPHIEWEEHDVGGYWLARPAPDTLGRFTLLPRGSILMIPHLVRDTSNAPARGLS